MPVAGRDYSPGGVHEGKLGSSIELTAFNKDKLASLTFVSVLYPFKSGTKAPATSNSGGIVKVNSDTLTLNNGTLTLSKGDKSESFKLW
ncbi:MAG: hypothetical protein JXR78_14545 [Victivallales bacterium]|nr:hypothetical protein [Victivallales bacterium]